MTAWDLYRMRYEIRNITGLLDTTQIPDSSIPNVPISASNPPGIDDYINDFYLYDLDEEMRTLKLKDFYTFTTVPNCGTYAVPQFITQLEPPIYIDNYQFAWYQSPDMFYRIWPELNFIDRNLFTPDGVTSSFTFQLTQGSNLSVPNVNLTTNAIQQGTVVIGCVPNQDGPFPSASPILETFTDSDQPIPLDIPLNQYFVNPGLLLSNQYTGPMPPPAPGTTPGTGIIDYLTGDITITYVTAPPSGINTSCHYHPYVPSRSRDILYFQDQLFLRPIPNDTYLVKLLAYFLPTTVMSAGTSATVRPSENVDYTTTPPTVSIQGFTGQNGSLATDLTKYNEWWQLVVYGAALKIFIRLGDHEQYQANLIYFERAKLNAQRRCLKQLSNQRIPTAYSTDGSMTAQFPIFPYY